MTPPPLPQEPLFFERILKPKVWGGTRLARRLRIELPESLLLGETWELSDYPGAETVVRGGACHGHGLRALMEHHGAFLLGGSRPSPDGRFPLLVKFLEAAGRLSVQVHPPDGPLSPTGVGKTEAWYVMEAAPGAAVACGVKTGTPRATFEGQAGGAQVVEHLHHIPVHAGDCVLVPAGLPHTILPGVVLCEIQQTSDVTYRMYDWDRPGDGPAARALHLPEALASVNYELPQVQTVRASFAGDEPLQLAPLVTCPYFRLQALRLGGAARREAEGLARVVVVLAGGVEIRPRPPARFASLSAQGGDVFLWPAGLAELEIESRGGAAHWLEGVAL